MLKLETPMSWLAEQEQADHWNGIRKPAGDNLPATLFLLQFSLSCEERQPTSVAGCWFWLFLQCVQSHKKVCRCVCMHMCSSGCWCVVPASDDNWKENGEIAVKLATPQPWTQAMEVTAESSFLTIKAAQPVSAVWVHSLPAAQSELFLASLCSVAQPPS